MPYKTEDFLNWIDNAESNFGKVKSEYTTAREYVENKQTPSNVPANKEYVQKNLITDLSRRRQGEIVSAEITPAVVGGGKMAKAKRELFFDILENNKFRQHVFPAAISFFYPEGYAGLKVWENPRLKSKYGIGCLKIGYLKPDELLLDPDARDGYHEDDIFRVHRKKIPLDYAKQRWPESAKDIYPSEELLTSNDNQTTKYCDLYEIEYRESVLKSEGGIDTEEEVFYIVKVINKKVVVEKPQRTGYPVFRMIPLIHTPRHESAGKYPMGLYALLGAIQDSINVSLSVALDAVKASIKQFVFMTGVKPSEAENIKDELSKTTGVHASMNTAAKMNVLTGNPIPPALLQWISIMEQAFDNVSGAHDPEKGQLGSRELSGKAINSLQLAGAIPEIASLANIETALTDVAICIYHYINTSMSQEFIINRQIGGKNRMIAYNMAVPEGMPGDEYNYVHGGMINPLAPEGERVSVKVIMNKNERDQLEINKALLLDERGKIALQDLMQVLYPHNWPEKLENLKSEQAVMALVQDIAQTAPEALQAISDYWQNEIKPLVMQQEQMESQSA